MSIRVALADDHKMFRSGLKGIVSGFEGMEVVGEAENGAKALELVKELNPDLLLLDINMPILSGMEVLAELQKQKLPVKVIMISMHDDDEHIVKALAAGAQGYLCKNADPEEIKKAIEEVSKGTVYFNERTNCAMLNSLVYKTQTPKSADTAREILSDKEMKILQLLAEGMGNEEIAQTIYASTRTIENLRYSMMKKLGVNNGMSLLVYAIKNQLVRI